MARLSWTVEEILAATGGQCLSGSRTSRFAGIGIDSRTIGADELFVAIRGEIHDGHRFAQGAVSGGVRGVLVASDNCPDLPVAAWDGQNVACIAVPDTTVALGQLATFNRNRARVPVVAITGSNGKTTTREMTAGVLGVRFNTLTPKGNFNNEIGLPLTLLDLAADHRMAVVELGMNHSGEILRLGGICRPDVGVITNIGPAHLEGVGSIEGVAAAKGELLETITAGGTAVLNADDHRVAALAERTRHRVLRYGRTEPAPIRGEAVSVTEQGTRFTLCLPDATVAVALSVRGAFMVSNALAAAAVGHCMGLSAAEIKTGLERFEPVRGRLNLTTIGDGIRLIDDTYNANPASMAAAIDTFRDLRQAGRGFMVMGDMLELGGQSAPLHREIGKKAAESGIHRLYVTGSFSGSVADGAAGAMPPARIFTGSHEEILEALAPLLGPGDWILVKGSRGMRMERIVEGLKQRIGA